MSEIEPPDSDGDAADGKAGASETAYLEPSGKMGSAISRAGSFLRSENA